MTARSQVRGANHSYTPIETKLLSINQAAPEQILQNLACWNEATFAHPTTTVNVTTPPLYQGDIWRTGVRPSGNYWGSMGENIDLLSGNLNFNLPLLKAQSRGFGATFTLSYNSQQWRQDANGQWKHGVDSGYGWGWKLQAGALTPLYSDYWTIAKIRLHRFHWNRILF